MRNIANEIADDARDPDDGKDASGNQVRRDEWADYRAGKLPLPWSKIPVVGEFRGDAWRDGLTEICGASKRAISDSLTELGHAGYELRKPITDKDGKPVVGARGRLVFAAKGNAISFQVPYLPPRPAPRRSHQSATFRPKPAPECELSGQRSHPDVPKVAPECDPFPSSPLTQDSPHLSPRAKVADKVRQAVPDATEREIDAFMAQVEAARSPDHIDRYVAGYPRATIAREIEAIRAGGATADLRRAGELRTAIADRTPVPPQHADQCGRCCRPGHAAAACPDREPAPAPTPAPAPAAPVEPCAAGEQCLRPLASPIDSDTGKHVRCAAVAAVRASLAVRSAAPAATGGDLAAEAARQVAEARALREGTERAEAGAAAS